MKIVVPFKATPDPDATERAEANGARDKRTINPFDLIALEEALRIKERGDAEEIVAVTIGPSRVEEQIRAAMAMGVDRVVRVDESRDVDSYYVAHVLKSFVDREAPRLVVMGKQAIDDDCNQAGQMLAGLLNWPQATFVSRIELDSEKSRALCTRETDDGLQAIEVILPAVITTDLRLNEPRYVSLPGILRARRQSFETLTVDQLSVNAAPRTVVIGTEPAPQRPPGALVQSVDELLSKLREEVKVL